MPAALLGYACRTAKHVCVQHRVSLEKAFTENERRHITLRDHNTVGAVNSCQFCVYNVVYPVPVLFFGKNASTCCCNGFLLCTIYMRKKKKKKVFFSVGRVPVDV